MKEPRFPHIKIKGDDTVFEKGYGRGGTKLEGISISSSQFKSKITDILSSNDIKTTFAGKKFFEIDLRLDYYHPIPQDLFKKLGVIVRGVYPTDKGDRKVIVSGDSELIDSYKKRARINKDFLRCIVDIKPVESNKKIGGKLREIWNSGQELKTEIGFLGELSNDEMRELKQKEIYSKLNFSKYTNTASALLTKEEIEKISEIPIVKTVSKRITWEATFLSQASTINTTPLNIKSPQNDLPAVGVIDTGVSEKFNSFCEYYGNFENKYDHDSHGSAVASLCSFNIKDLKESNVLNPEIKILSGKISETSRSDEINIFDEIISFMEKTKSKTKIYCISWNCFDYDKQSYEDLLRKLDTYLQTNNLLLINSVGNLKRELGRSLFSQYPAYLFENSVFPKQKRYER